MPIVSNFGEGWVEKKELSVVDVFRNQEIIKRAQKDFVFLCTRSNFTYRLVLNVYEMSKMDKIGDFVVVGATNKQSLVTFPQGIVDLNNPDLSVAVIIYNGEDVENVYLFKAQEWAKKQGMFSPFKILNRTGEFGISFSKPQKFVENKFGVVLKEFI